MKSKFEVSYSVLQPLLLSAMVALGMLVGYRMNEAPGKDLITSIDDESGYPIGRVEEVLRFIESKYMDDVNSDSLKQAAIQALFSQLDPHSIYLTPEEMDDVHEATNGHYKGIGIETLLLDDTIHVVSVFGNSPAQKAGIQPFDQIIAINDSLIAGQQYSFAYIRNMLRSNGNQSAIQLRIIKYGERSPKTVQVRFEEISVSSCSAAFMVDDSTGFIKIDQFTETSYKDFMEELEVLHDSFGLRHLIIDVRENPGGVLSEVTKIVNQLFREKEKLIVYTEGKHSKKTTYNTTGNTFFNIDKIAVLINETSASASEILAGAVQDWDRGVVIGRRSFGKGLVQEQYDLANGGAIRLTTARYYTPAGRSIQKDYRERSRYDYELQDRLESGRLEKRQNLDKGSPLKTLVLGRDVYKDYGISPDIFVPLDGHEYSELEAQLSEYNFEFAYSFVRQLNAPSKSGPMTADDKVLDQYLEYARSRMSDFPESLDENVRAGLKIKLEYQLNYHALGKKRADSLYLRNDPMILTATDFFKSGKTLTDLH